MKSMGDDKRKGVLLVSITQWNGWCQDAKKCEIGVQLQEALGCNYFSYVYSRYAYFVIIQIHFCVLFSFPLF